jgi:outer membrane cobalamin receptor
VDLSGTFREDVRYPDIDELKLYNRARYAYPNASLKEEERIRMTGDMKWNPGGIVYGVGLRYEYVDNPIKQRWVTGKGLESIETASQWINLDYAEALDWYVAAGFSIGNWQLYLEREQSLSKQNRPIDVTNLYYKGYIRWSDKFVKNRLGVSVAFNFTWFGNRYDLQMTEDENGKEMLEVIELKHYLALNFEARMRILTFSLYSRIDNLNHSLYEPAAGYRPEGVRFLYGITWSFDN